MALAQIAHAHPQIDAGADVLEALDCLRVAVTLFDSDERLTYCNNHYHHLLRSLPPFHALLGLRYADLIRLEIASREIADAESLDVEQFIACRRQQLLEGDLSPFDLAMADGRIIELKSRRTRQGGWIVLWNDATHARNLLARLADTIELSVDAFAFWSEGDRLVLCNAAFADIHGLQSLDDGLGMSFAELIRHAHSHGRIAIDGAVEDWFQRRLDAHRSAVGALTLSTPSGESYLVRERATRGGGSVTVLTDVSERHRAESALAEQTHAVHRARRALLKSKTEAKRRTSYLADLTRRLNAAETEMDTAKSTLLRTMSHELRTPLNVILGFADLLKSSPERFTLEQTGEYAARIHEAGSNLLRLINQILDLTKIAAGRYVLNPAPVVVPQVFGAIRVLEAARIREKSLTVDSSRCPRDFTAEADEAALSTMLGHLFDNALAYAPEGGQIRLSASRREGLVRIAVSDNGPGVEAEELDRILEPFEQIGRGTDGHAAGAGLGLPLVKALAELHGGALLLESQPGQGFTATIELPAA